MVLYKWDTVLYDAVKAYFPRCLKSAWKKKRRYNMGTVNRLSLSELNEYIKNTDIYLAGAQVVLNLGFTQLQHSPVEYGILPHPVEDLKHVRKYTSTPRGGQMEYYHPFKKRTLMFR